MKAEKTLFPESHQVIFGKVEGSSRLHSLFVGFTAPFMNLPTMLWRGVIFPPLRGLWFIGHLFIAGIIGGVLGRVHGRMVKMPVMHIAIVDARDEEAKR